MYELKIKYRQADNCFSLIEKPEEAQKRADQFSSIIPNCSHKVCNSRDLTQPESSLNHKNVFMIDSYNKN